MNKQNLIETESDISTMVDKTTTILLNECSVNQQVEFLSTVKNNLLAEYKRKKEEHQLGFEEYSSRISTLLQMEDPVPGTLTTH